MMTKSHSNYRRGVGIILLNNINLVFVGKRFDIDTESWQMPQGGIDDGEEPLEAAMRELYEELGTANAQLISFSDKVYKYDLPIGLRYKFWNGRYVGQEQIWFMFRYLGDDSQINIKTADQEFSDWKWIEFRRLPDIIVDFKKQLYIELVQDFSNLIESVNAT